MGQTTPLVEVDPSQLSRSEWTKILWGVLWRGSPYTLPPLIAVIVIVSVFGLVLGIMAVEVGISGETIQEYDWIFEIVGDLMTSIIGIYVFARNLRLLPQLQLGPYRFALLKSAERDARSNAPVQ